MSPADKSVTTTPMATAATSALETGRETPMNIVKMLGLGERHYNAPTSQMETNLAERVARLSGTKAVSNALVALVTGTARKGTGGVVANKVLRDWCAEFIAPREVCDPTQLEKRNQLKSLQRLAAHTTPQRLGDAAALLLMQARAIDTKFRFSDKHVLLTMADQSRYTARNLSAIAVALAQYTGQPFELPAVCSDHLRFHASQVDSLVPHVADGLSIATAKAPEQPRNYVAANSVPRRRYTPEDRQRFLQEAEQPGESLASVGRRHDISPDLLSRWRAREEKKVIDSIVSGKHRPTKRELDQLGGRLRGLERALGAKTVEIVRQAVAVVDDSNRGPQS